MKYIIEMHIDFFQWVSLLYIFLNMTQRHQVKKFKNIFHNLYLQWNFTPSLIEFFQKANLLRATQMLSEQILRKGGQEIDRNTDTVQLHNRSVFNELNESLYTVCRYLIYVDSVSVLCMIYDRDYIYLVICEKNSKIH